MKKYSSEGGILSSVKSGISSMIGLKDKTTGEKFHNALKDPKKTKISFMLTSLKRALDFYDFMQKRNVLLVYVENNIINKLPIEIFVFQAFGEEIEKNFAFIGVNEQSSEMSIIEPFLTQKKVPTLLVFVYDELGALKNIGSLIFDDAMSKNKAQISLFLKEMTKISDGILSDYEQGIEKIERLQKGVHEQGQNYHQEYNDEMDIDDNFDQMHPNDGTSEQQRLEFKKQWSQDRRMKNNQDQVYQETLKKIEQDQIKKKEEELQKAIEAEKMRKKEEEIQNLNKVFENEKVNPSRAVMISLRMPDGQRVERLFDKGSKIRYVMQFVATLDKKHFENNQPNFNLAAGFPPKQLDPEMSLEQIFGNSENELIHVKEI